MSTIAGCTLTAWWFWRAVVFEYRLVYSQNRLFSTRQLVHRVQRERVVIENMMLNAFASLQREQRQRYLQVHSLATLGKLTTSILHDVANPLTYATIVAEHGGNSNALVLRGLRQIALMIESTRRQLQYQGNQKRFCINTEIRRAKLFLQHRWKANKLDIQLKLEPNLWTRGDACRFYQCISNLTLNAIEAYDDTDLPATRRTIEIRLQKNRNVFEVRVRDQATGIPNHLRRHVFTPLFTTKSPTDGLGIGLSWTRDIIEQTFRGQITFKTMINRGTTFLVTIPISL